MSQNTPNTSVNTRAVNFKVRKKRNNGRRTRIPDKPDRAMNLWGVMKNSIGKDITKIPMPINFSEPLSFLQRVAEDFSYSHLLDEAALCKDSTEQIARLAAFTISCYSGTSERTAKPFNPLLGETYEWDRTDDLGWRLISEQVSHHPPISAQHCESQEWTCWQELSMSSKFRGKYIMVSPLGISHIVFHRTKTHYSWNKATTTINNIIVGRIWLENTGEIDIVSHDKSCRCHLSYHPYSLFRSDDHKKVTGLVRDSKDQVKWVLNAKWDSEVVISRVLSISGSPREPVYQLDKPISIWRVATLPPESHKFYYFSLFACQSNELEEDIAPTDSRYRPDQRLMELGNWDEATILKGKLEVKQRERRRQESPTKGHTQKRDKIYDSISKSSIDIVGNGNQGFEPAWFHTQTDAFTGRSTYIYKGGYWEAKEVQDWSKCRDIYTL